MDLNNHHHRISPQALYEAAREVVGEYTLTHRNLKVGTVGAALLTADGNVYTGVNLDMFCGIGFCAEHAAVAEMLKNRETHILMAVAVKKHTILPPCGRCRELMYQVDVRNRETQIMLPREVIQPLEELLPSHWMEYADPNKFRPFKEQ